MTSLPLTIATDHPAFDGHFPSHPIMPGVVLLDESLHAIGVARSLAAPARIASAKFLSIVGPGESVRVEFDAATGNGAVQVRVHAGDAPDERLAMTAVVHFVHA